jgi:hypothetical protein
LIDLVHPTCIQGLLLLQPDNKANSSAIVNTTARIEQQLPSSELNRGNSTITMEPVALSIPLESPLDIASSSLVAASSIAKRPLYRRQTSPHFHSGHVFMDDDTMSDISISKSPLAVTNISEQQHLQHSHRHHNASASDVLDKGTVTTFGNSLLARKHVSDVGTAGVASNVAQHDRGNAELLPRQQQLDDDTTSVGNRAI